MELFQVNEPPEESILRQPTQQINSWDHKNKL